MRMDAAYEIRRRGHDVVALVMHFGTFFVMGFVTDPFVADPVPAVLLAAMQGTAFVWHAWYVAAHYGSWPFKEPFFNGVQNQYKWYEYMMSATAGSTAVLTASGTDTMTVVSLAIGAVLQQLGGRTIDMLRAGTQLRQHVPVRCNETGWRDMPKASSLSLWFLFASATQIIEFYFVSVGDAPAVLKVVYIIAWGSFGVHAGLRLWSLRGPRDTTRWPRYSEPQWVEAVYSCLGWTAKIAVFTAEWAYLNGLNLTRLDRPLLGIVAVELVLAANVAWVCRTGQKGVAVSNRVMKSRF